MSIKFTERRQAILEALLDNFNFVAYDDEFGFPYMPSVGYTLLTCPYADMLSDTLSALDDVDCDPEMLRVSDLNEDQIMGFLLAAKHKFGYHFVYVMDDCDYGVDGKWEAEKIFKIEEVIEFAAEYFEIEMEEMEDDPDVDVIREYMAFIGRSIIIPERAYDAPIYEKLSNHMIMDWGLAMRERALWRVREAMRKVRGEEYEYIEIEWNECEGAYDEVILTAELFDQNVQIPEGANERYLCFGKLAPLGMLKNERMPLNNLAAMYHDEIKDFSYEPGIMEKCYGKLSKESMDLMKKYVEQKMLEKFLELDSWYVIKYKPTDCFETVDEGLIICAFESDAGWALSDFSHKSYYNDLEIKEIKKEDFETFLKEQIESDNYQAYELHISRAHCCDIFIVPFEMLDKEWRKNNYVEIIVDNGIIKYKENGSVPLFDKYD